MRLLLHSILMDARPDLTQNKCTSDVFLSLFLDVSQTLTERMKFYDF